MNEPKTPPPQPRSDRFVWGEGDLVKVPALTEKNGSATSTPPTSTGPSLPTDGQVRTLVFEPTDE